jgi:hypothetical protein
MYLYTVRDLLAKEYGPIFQAKNDDVAGRSFRDLIAKNNVRWEEYELYCVGMYDMESGKIIDTSHRQIDVENLAVFEDGHFDPGTPPTTGVYKSAGGVK